MNRKTKIKHWAINILLLGLVTLACLVAGELIARMVLNPVNYLRPVLIADGLLKLRVEPHSAGHDDWGFRNEEVPAEADIVTLGDSQTYGVNAPATASWPAVLGRILQKEVYNMAMGAYGPVQYSYLAMNQAIHLNPSMIIAGFYYGNDLLDAYQLAHGNRNWNHLRKTDQSGYEPSDDDPVLGDHYTGMWHFIMAVRTWLGQNSILYRLFTDNLGEVFRYLEMKYTRSGELGVTILDDDVRNIHTGFTPNTRLEVLNLDNQRVREGLEISLDLFAEMNRFCAEKGMKFTVVIIPTKESVFAELIENNDQLLYSDTIDLLLENEREVNRRIKEFFTEHGIGFVDVLKPLQESILSTQCYPSNWDGHPNKNGYEVIGRAVYEYLQTLE